MEARVILGTVETGEMELVLVDENGLPIGTATNPIYTSGVTS